MTRLLFIFAGLTFAHRAHADEGGAAFWLSGQYASMAAVPSDPGWSLEVMPYFYSGSADKSKLMQRGEILHSGSSTRESIVQFQLGYSAQEKILGGQPYIGVSFGPGANTTTAYSVVSANRYFEATRTESVTGSQDIAPLASLSWNKGNNNYMTYITGNIPVGTYSPSSLATVGLGRAAVDVGGAYTYLNSQSGFEFSGVLGATYNWMNKQTNYKSGIDSHLDWSVSQSVSSQWQIGIAGYVYYQLTGDSGSGNTVGSNKSQVAAVGPQIGYLFNIEKKQVSINIRAYREFWAQNRPEGYAAIATISIPFGM